MNPLVNNSGSIISNIIKSFTMNKFSPKTLCENMLAQNTQAREMISSMQQACGTRNPREYVLEQCEAQGISREQVMQLAQTLGIK